ncbi:MAG: hypothetical protein FWE35_18945 [Streptosporangiales bacterium]|nr:hypothetical protein [Streptosporangiales bacterium]
MGDWGGVPAGTGGLMAETLGLVMARRAADVLSRRRVAIPCPRERSGPAGPAGGPDGDPEREAADNAIFDAVLDAANECLGRFDRRPAEDRWCDALLQVLRLAESDSPR